MNLPEDRKIDIVASVGLALGAIFGMLGTVVPQASLRSLFWGIDGAALVMATTLLTIKFAHKGSDLVAAGFITFAIGEGVILSGAAGDLAASGPSFAAGTVLWATGLLLISFPKEFAGWIRLIGFVASLLFFFIAARIFLGEQILPTASPLPFFAYPFLVGTMIGWIWTLLREKV